MSLQLEEKLFLLQQ